MADQDSVAGTVKQLVAEIVGDGKLAEEGSREAAAGSTCDPVEAAGSSPLAQAMPQRNDRDARLMASPGDENRFAGLLGRAALKVWADLPRSAQEQLFAAAVDDGAIATDLAELLHDRHPKTAHPPSPTRLA
ncbi:hypothetical protein ACTGJ9_009350 [Bradyrhizobium sp. RDM12]